MNKKIDYLENKILKNRRKIKKLNAQKRKERKQKLIKLGTLFNVLDLLDVEQDIMLGYIYKYKENIYKNKEILREKGNNILKNHKKITYPNDSFYIKRMFYKMIRKAALFEKLKLHKEDPNILIAFLDNFKNIDDVEKNELKEIGYFVFFKKNKIITDDEKLQLLKFSIKNNINLQKILNDKKTTIHTLTYEILEKIKNEYNIKNFSGI